MKLEKLRDILETPEAELHADDVAEVFKCVEALLDLAEAVKYIARMNCPQNPETALGRSLRSAVNTCNETLARLEAVE